MRRLGSSPKEHFAGVEDLPEYHEWSRGKYGLYVHRDANGWVFGVFIGDPLQGLLAAGGRFSRESATRAAEFYAGRFIAGYQPTGRFGDWVSPRI